MGSPDAEVLARLLLVRDLLQLAEPEQLRAVLARGLEAVPGVLAVVSCDDEDPPPPTGLLFPVGTATRARGCLRIEVADAATFAPYEPFVRNLVAALSLLLENAEQRADLAAAHERMDAYAQRCSAELEAATRDIASLSYAFSHELRAPLRAIDGFAAILDEEAGPGLDVEARAHLQRIRSASRHMARLLDDVQLLLGIVHAPVRHIPVDLAELARAAIAERRREEPHRDVELVAPPNLVAYGDAALLEHVVRALIDNAWKFTAGRARARVEVGETPDRTYFVRDDGSGFDADQATHVFEPFWRAHQEAEYPGRGLGLAVARRAIVRHGGRIWAESAPGRGATIWFILPG
ncbi:MAG: sensor histidine kinase [Myxococcota bacterium]